MNRRSLMGFMAAVAVVCTLALAGCSGLPELPFGNPFAKLFETTSVAEARAAQLQARTPKLAAPDLVSDGVLTVGLMTDSISAPFCITADDGGVSGMDIDIASAIADELGLNVQFVAVPDIAQPLAASVCDIVMDASADHASGAAVVGSYYESAATFFHRGESGVVNVSALSGATVGLQKNSVSEGVLNRTGLVMTERMYDTLNLAFDGLRGDSVNYVLCNAYQGAYLAAAYDGINFAGTLNAPLPVGIAVAAEKNTVQEAVRQALDSISANGVMSIVRSRWIGGMPSITASDEIRDVPGASSTSFTSEDDGELESGELQNGSSAGSNAVTMTS